MKKLLGLCATLFLALAASTVFTTPILAATDLTGSWTAQLQTPDGNTMDLAYTFKQDGNKLTGSVQGPQGDPLDILNGKVDGEKVYWEVNFNGATITQDGTVSGDGNQIKVSVKSSDGSFPAMDLTLNRAGQTPAASPAAAAGTASNSPAPATTGATGATGTWTAQMQGPNGDMTLTFHFKQDGGALTGSVENPMGGDPMPIQNGKIDGDKIHWETTFNGMTISHDGTVNGDEMKISAKSSDGSFPGMDLILKRAK